MERILITGEYNMSRYTWLLDPGHGGFIDGVYQTAGKRSPLFPDGSQFFEGEFTRDIARRIVALSDGSYGNGLRSRRLRNKVNRAKFSLDVVNLVDTEEDVPLRTRVNTANQIHREKRNCIYISIHANAHGMGRSFKDPKAKARGTCTFYHYKSSKGEVLAESLQRWLADLTPFRNRGIRANETWANFYVLRKTHMPAVLSENGFMTNFDDATLLMDPDVRQAVANAHYNMMLEIDENGL